VLTRALGATPSAPSWNARADLDHNLTVDAADRSLFERAGLCRVVETATPTPTATATPTETPSATPSSGPTETPGTSVPTPATATPTRTAVTPVPPTDTRLYLPLAQKPR
jgi:hypothetical protein